tara:strand:+ start:53524 stop:54147 length:624 start_codon:yes stop_codon:yes gene_type:complete
MRFSLFPVFALVCAFLSAPAALAQEEGELSSIYTKMDFETGCIRMSVDEVGASFSCAGHRGYGILFAESDLRQSVFFGYVGPWYADGAWESFSAFNQTNDTVEWRLSDGRPYATILRWYIENPNPDTGAPDEAHRGQVLVVSRVAQPGEGSACVVGYVDALANPNANEMARDVADTLAADFTCMSDAPAYHGQRGPLAGEPMRVLGQ